MSKTKLFLQMAIVLAALAIPAVASADPGTIHDALRGTAFDPYATTMRIVPPKGGAVLVYRRGKAVGWWLQPGITTVRPGQVYGVLATKGTRMIFNGGVLVRPGTTSLVWDGGDLPQVAYMPAYHHRPHYVAVHGHRGSSHHVVGNHHGTSAAKHATPREGKRQLKRTKVKVKKLKAITGTKAPKKKVLKRKIKVRRIATPKPIAKLDVD